MCLIWRVRAMAFLARLSALAGTVEADVCEMKAAGMTVKTCCVCVRSHAHRCACGARPRAREREARPIILGLQGFWLRGPHTWSLLLLRWRAACVYACSLLESVARPQPWG